MSRAVVEVFNGGTDPGNPYNWFIGEYSDRIRMAKLGFHSDYDKLDAFKASVFQKIDTQISFLTEQRRKRKEAEAKLKRNQRG